MRFVPLAVGLVLSLMRAPPELQQTPRGPSTINPGSSPELGPDGPLAESAELVFCAVVPPDGPGSAAFRWVGEE